MKAQVEASNNNNLKTLHRDGKVHKAKHNHSSPYKEEDNPAEIEEYLNKLQELVPFMPKNKELSNFEVITYVIDYIQDLSETLGLPPSPPSSLPSSSSCDEDDEPIDDDDDFETEKAEEVSSTGRKVTVSLKSSNNLSATKDEHIVHTRSPLRVHQDNKLAEGGQ